MLFPPAGKQMTDETGSPGHVLCVNNAIPQRVEELPRVCSGGSCTDTYQLLAGRGSKNVTCCKAGNEAVALVLLHFLPRFLVSVLTYLSQGLPQRARGCPRCLFVPGDNAVLLFRACL